MTGINTSIDDVGASSLTSAGIILIGGAATSTVGDAAKTPRSIGLLSESLESNDGILLNVLDL